MLLRAASSKPALMNFRGQAIDSVHGDSWACRRVELPTDGLSAGSGPIGWLRLEGPEFFALTVDRNQFLF